MCVKWLCFFTVLSGLAASGVLQVSGMRIYTPADVQAVNGTDVRLKCTFQSSSPLNADNIVITWRFRPLVSGQEETVFFYQRKPYPPMDGIFRKHITWTGDVMGRDASITIRDVKFKFNGTYLCQVMNPPDVSGSVGEIRLRVVTTASFSELVLLALGIGGGIAVVVILLVIIMSCRRCKRRRQRQLEESEEAPPKDRKVPTVCHPLRAAHTYLSETSLKIDSSGDMVSEEEGLRSDDDDNDGDDSN